MGVWPFLAPGGHEIVLEIYMLGKARSQVCSALGVMSKTQNII